MASYCSGCGYSLSNDARFCSSCGKPVAGASFASASDQRLLPLMRPRAGRKLAGVCRGLANHYGWDVTLTRVIAVLLAIGIFPVGIVAYVLFWVLLPEELVTTVAVSDLRTTF
jgi:phage shock protein C